MNSKLFLLSLLFVSLFYRSYSNEDCDKWTDDSSGEKYACGTGCTGTPSCGKKNCGNVDNMCYCNCEHGNDLAKCQTTSGGVTAGQFGAMPHLKLKFLPNFQSRLKTFFWNL